MVIHNHSIRYQVLFSVLFTVQALIMCSSFTRDKAEPFCAIDSHNKVKILMVRHGKTDWNELSKIQGHTDRPLNKKGIYQAQLTAQFLLQNKEYIDAVYASDLRRAAATGNEISAVFNRTITLHAALRERDMGDAEGIHERDFHELYGPVEAYLEKIYPNRWERWHHSHVPGAETQAAIVIRVETFLKEIAPHHQGQAVVVVSHGTVIKTMITHYTECYEEVPNCSIAEFEYDVLQDSFSFKGIRVVNETSLALAAQ